MDTAGLMAGKTNSDGAMLGSIAHHHQHHHHHHQHHQQHHQQHPHNPLRHGSPTRQLQANSHHHPSDSLTEVSVVDINASLAASAPLISPHVAPMPQIVPAGAGTGTGPGTGGSVMPGFCNILNASNSSDLQAVAYNSLTQNVRCKSPPTLVDNLKNGTIGHEKMAHEVTSDPAEQDLPAVVCIRPISPTGGGGLFRLGALPPSGCSSLEDLDDTVEGTTIYQLSCDNHYNLSFYANRCADAGSDADSVKNFKNHPTVWVKR
uniref:Uncharacterized protein n=1 Tax=Anopheles farauti TaxID=69004 RepID=A0A182QJU6_9DIPT